MSRHQLVHYAVGAGMFVTIAVGVAIPVFAVCALARLVLP